MNRCVRVWVAAALAMSGCAGGNSDGAEDAGRAADAMTGPPAIDAATPTVDAAVDAATPAADAAVDAATPAADAAAPAVDAAMAPVDAGTPDAGSTGGVCNPVTQTGCAPGDKCAFILDDPATGIGHTGCITNGTASIGGACSSATTAGSSDTCAAGGHCYQGVCNEICAVGGAPCATGYCVGFEGLDFDVCLPDCDPLTQNCTGTNQGCYLIVGGAVCAGVVGGTGVGPGSPCEYLNDCEPFSSCFDDGMGGGRCLRYCGPIDMCFDIDGNPTMCACGTSSTDTPATEAKCDVDEVCGGITGEDVVGVCLEASELGCDCAATPICPPAM